MGEKDAVHKILESYNDVFADIINVLVFNGEPVVHENDLIDRTPHAFYKAAGSIHEEIRDIAKIWQHNQIRISCLGIENQVGSDPDMPLRVIGYDGAEYRAQLLSENPGNDRYAVITLVLYFGYENQWSGPTNLKARVHIPRGMEHLVSDYRINLFQIAYLTPEQVSMFRSDFRIVADYYVQMRENGDYVPSAQQMKHVEAVLQLLHVFEQDERFLDIYNEFAMSGRPEQGGITMCDVLDRAVNKGITQGIEQGILTERENNIRTMSQQGAEPGLIARLLCLDLSTVQAVLSHKE